MGFASFEGKILMDEESYFVFPGMNGGEFESLAELELAYGDNCVDGAISDTAELWAMRSGTSSPCVGSWSPSNFSLDDAIQEWATSQARRPDDTGLYITGFRAWVENQLSKSPEFGDFVWNRFVEFSMESMMNLKKNIKLACGDDIRFDSRMLYRFRDRIGVQPYYVNITVPPMPTDTEERLVVAVAQSRKPKRKTMRVRLSKAMFATSKHTDEGIASALSPSQKKQEKGRHVGPGTEADAKKGSVVGATDDQKGGEGA